ncbi:hypothetical protein Moror_8077 [Moniliophthora roreri MCA 2997]|uniref:DH domain-containing protein n=1 Tax=Moniliophthora roreri (strain MCA 2997) TaxID=1381753 RepID=V2YRX7_MONRO|nr:hypothetical protein Moror_8077 [Moniliophthora roreri MCA 2997]
MGVREGRMNRSGTVSAASVGPTGSLGSLQLGSMDTTVVKKLSENGSSHTNRSRRPIISGFLPLPSISASPVCTPTTSTSSRDYSLYSDSCGSGDDKTGSDSVPSEIYQSTPSTPCDQSSLRVSTAPTPTWISTPPTPPPKVVKRSVTCMPRRISSPVTPSASFPASMSPHADTEFVTLPQRCTSTPTLSRSRSASESSAFRSHPPISMKTRPQFVSASQLRSGFIPPRESIPILFARSKPLFELIHQSSMDHHDDDILTSSREKRSDCGHSVESASSLESGEECSEKLSREKERDSARKYHALVELLSTEVAYLQDLRILISVYLRNISTLRRNPSSSTFGRNSSFSALSRNSSSSQMTGSMSSSTGHGLDVHGLQPLTSITTSAKEKEKSPARYLFTDTEVEMLTRNAEDVLQFHERFVEELKLSMSGLGIPMEPVDGTMSSDESRAEKSRPGIANVDAGIAVVSTKFATESSRFSLYQVFCAGHPEALDVLRRVQQLYPSEWDMFEQRCSMALDPQLGADRSGSTTPDSIGFDTPVMTTIGKKRRRASISAADQTSRTLRSWPSSMGSQPPKEPHTDPTRNRSRLFFMDYLIKPVQRICKYPLLLDQLKTGKTLRAMVGSSPLGRRDVNVVVESAALAMRHVAGQVDEARRQQDVAARSSLIISRTSVSPISTTMASTQPLQVLTSSFLSSLGTCLFAGSLDVIHNRSTKHSTNTTSINVKYLGAFLYMGGYLILVKVLKGKVYEPRHWFGLIDFQISDPDESEAWLPCSFRLACRGHEFELAAACKPEKEAWIAAIRESLAHPKAEWVNEPISSLHVDGKGELVSSILDGPFEIINPLPTIQSVSELVQNDDDETDASTKPLPPLPSPPFDALPDDYESQHKSKRFSRNSTPDISHPSRHSSSASMKSILSPMAIDSDTIIIRRSLPSTRAQIDLGLQDVISEACMNARSQATVREEGLFQAPNTSRTGIARSTGSALSMKKLKKHESVRIPRRRSLAADARDDVKSRTKSLSRGNTLSITSTSSDGLPPFPDAHHYVHYPSSPPFSQCSSNLTTSAPPSHESSPTHGGPFMSSKQTRPETVKHKRTQRNSIVGSVRSLFLSHPTSPGSPRQTYTEDTFPKHISHGFLRRWAKSQSAKSHRRTHSAPDKPNDSFQEKHNTIIAGLALHDSSMLPQLGSLASPTRWPESPDRELFPDNKS